MLLTAAAVAELASTLQGATLEAARAALRRFLESTRARLEGGASPESDVAQSQVNTRKA
jgi:outer membrane protein TolC